MSEPAETEFGEKHDSEKIESLTYPSDAEASATAKPETAPQHSELTDVVVPVEESVEATSADGIPLGARAEGAVEGHQSSGAVATEIPAAKPLNVPSQPELVDVFVTDDESAITERVPSGPENANKEGSPSTQSPDGIIGARSSSYQAVVSNFLPPRKPATVSRRQKQANVRNVRKIEANTDEETKFTHRQVHKVFRAFDSNNDRTLTRNEFSRLLSSVGAFDVIEGDNLDGLDDGSSQLRITARTTGFMELCDPDGTGEVTAKEFSNVFLGRSVKSIILDPKNAPVFNPATQSLGGVHSHHAVQKESVTVVHFGAPTPQDQTRYDDEADTTVSATFERSQYYCKTKAMSSSSAMATDNLNDTVVIPARRAQRLHSHATMHKRRTINMVAADLHGQASAAQRVTIDSPLKRLLVETFRTYSRKVVDWENPRMWVDIRGWNLLDMTTVSDVFGIPSATVHDMKLSQPARFQIERIADMASDEPQPAKGTATDDVRSIMSHLVCHAVSLAHSGFDVTTGKLWSKDKLDRHPPRLQVYQLDVIVIKTPRLQDDDVLLTMMKDPLSFHPKTATTKAATLHGNAGDLSKPRGSSHSASEANDDDDETLDPLEELLNSLHDELQRAENGYIFARTGVVFLMWTILDGIIDELDYVRLVITEWIDALDDDITRSTPRNMHKQHLHDASVVLQDFVNVVKPLLSDMREFENDASALSVFCGENSEIFKKSYDELERIFADIEALMAKRKSLEEYFASSQAERLTKVLYILTLVTTMFVPAQFLTGLWGMNFSEMPELEWEHGYHMFWAICVVLVFGTLGVFWKFDLFNQ